MIPHYSVDQITNIPITFDIGSSVSIFPNVYQLTNDSPVSWYSSTNNFRVHILGSIERTIEINFIPYTWNFLIANIDSIILGSDFIANFRS